MKPKSKSASKSEYAVPLTLQVIVIILMVSISLSLFFSRHPQGYATSHVTNHREFRLGELLVALLFPSFYILYFIVSDPS